MRSHDVGKVHGILQPAHSRNRQSQVADAAGAVPAPLQRPEKGVHRGGDRARVCLHTIPSLRHGAWNRRVIPDQVTTLLPAPPPTPSHPATLAQVLAISGVATGTKQSRRELCGALPGAELVHPSEACAACAGPGSDLAALARGLPWIDGRSDAAQAVPAGQGQASCAPPAQPLWMAPPEGCALPLTQTPGCRGARAPAPPTPEGVGSATGPSRPQQAQAGPDQPGPTLPAPQLQPPPWLEPCIASLARDSRPCSDPAPAGLLGRKVTLGGQRDGPLPPGSGAGRRVPRPWAGGCTHSHRGARVTPVP